MNNDNQKEHFDYEGEIWAIANLVWGPIKTSEFNRVILPFTMLRRLECALEPTRDASNYKKFTCVVPKGTLSASRIDEIIDLCNEGEYFIPAQAGLPENRFEEFGEDDHCWFELTKEDFETTNEEPTAGLDMTAEELYRKFRAIGGKWDDVGRYKTLAAMTGA